MAETRVPQKWLLIATGLSIVVILIIRAMFAGMEQTMHASSPYGIVDFELAFSGNRAGTILSHWDRAAADAARASLLLDFLFIPAYAVAFVGITSLLTRSRPAPWQRTGRLLIRGVIVAALLDVLENLMLLYQLQGDVIRQTPPLIAGVAASIKFLLLGFTVVFWFVARIAYLLRNRTTSGEAV
jgi:hypothetical protein